MSSGQSVARTARLRTPVDVAGNGLVLGALWLTYSLVRSLGTSTEPVAIANAERLLAFQSKIGIALESWLQELVDAPAALVGANTYYLVHFPATVAVLVATYVRDRPGAFASLRNSLIAVTGIALVVHAVVPMAPPRMLGGFVDVSAIYGPNPYALPGSGSANQLAAMPSMHVAWAVLAAHACWTLSRRRPLRVLCLAHPIITTLVVLVTAHHFVADVAIGGFLAVVAVLVGSGRGRHGNHPPRTRSKDTRANHPAPPTQR